MPKSLISNNNLNNNKFYQNTSNNKEYYLIKENTLYKIIISKRKNDIVIHCDSYEIIINNKDLSIILNIRFNSNEEVYEFFINTFQNKKVFIKDLIINISIKLLFKIKAFNKEKDIEIVLLKKNECNNFNNDLNKKEKFNENSVIKINPKDIYFLNDLINNCYTYYPFLDNTFCVFNSVNDILYLIYANQDKSIISYNIIDNKKINEIKKAHNSYITNFRHHLNKNKKIDLIISISSDDNNIKLWNINNSECLLEIKNINKFGNLYSACFFNYNNDIYIVSSNYNYYGDCEPLKVFDFNGNKIKELVDSNEQTYFIDTYYDNELNINFIITGNKKDVRAYDYINKEIYHKYDDNDNKGHYSVILFSKNDIKYLIESSEDKNIRLWDFHSGELKNKIQVSKNYCLNGFCLWDDKYLFAGCYDKTAKLIDLDKGIIIKTLNGHNSRVLTVKKIIHPEYGESLISQGWNEKIKLWIKKK